MEKCTARHIAIITDGNGRWAKARGLSRSEGHAYGEKTFIEICEAASQMGVEYLTAYGFSTENWNRAKEEIDSLMNLFLRYITMYIEYSKNCNYKFQILGSRENLSTELVEAIKELERTTSEKTGMCIQIAFNYGGRNELLRAFRKMQKDIKMQGLCEDEISESDITLYLDTKQIPDPDIIIRTGGEKRLSNFLLWQCAYSELFFVDDYWPDFTKEKLFEILDMYKKRKRKFGAVYE